MRSYLVHQTLIIIVCVVSKVQLSMNIFEMNQPQTLEIRGWRIVKFRTWIGLRNAHLQHFLLFLKDEKFEFFIHHFIHPTPRQQVLHRASCDILIKLIALMVSGFSWCCIRGPCKKEPKSQSERAGNRAFYYCKSLAMVHGYIGWVSM